MPNGEADQFEASPCRAAPKDLPPSPTQHRIRWPDTDTTVRVRDTRPARTGRPPDTGTPTVRPPSRRSRPHASGPRPGAGRTGPHPPAAARTAAPTGARSRGRRRCHARRAAPPHRGRTARSADTSAPPTRSPRVGSETRRTPSGKELDGTSVGLAARGRILPTGYLIRQMQQTHRRRGVGTALMEEMERWARQQGATSVSLRTNLRSPLSMPFYEERMGYTRDGAVFRKRLRS
jgi:GNAT superfamily N-acetyltransferase